MEYSEIVAAAGRTLSRPGAPVTLRLTETVVDYPQARTAILRCAPAGPPADPPPWLPASLIVKHWRDSGGGLQQEWAALEFLRRAGVAGVAGVVPAGYGVDPAAQLLVLEDLAGAGQDSGLGSPHLLGNILFGDDPDRAERALIALNRTIGRLHAATIGGPDPARLPVGSARSRHPVHRLLAGLAALPELLAGNGVAVTTALTTEVAAAIAAIREPGPFLAFTHGDTTPNNAFCRDGEVRLFDLEAADFRHALVDGAFARLRYLYSVWARRIPVEVQRRGLAAYRRALAEGCPAAEDDNRFGQALLACGAGWLAVMCGELPSVAADDKKWGRSTVRQRIVTMIDHFAGLAEEFGAFPAVAAATSQLGRRLRSRWPREDCQLRSYPAFAGEPEG